MTRSKCIRTTAGALGFALVALVGAIATPASAFADDQVGGDNQVDVSVEISDASPPGILTMTVAGTSAQLVESTSDSPVIRQFSGSLPTVTVTDTRRSDQIPDGAYWSVLGSTSAFVGDNGQEPITPDHLGWAPHLLTPADEGEVAEGSPVETSLDEGPGNVGLVDRELLAMAWDSEEAVGEWSVNADLTLKVPVTTEPGTYSSVLTLSLFE
ncbi:hypothetical protein SAMN06295879_2120 [Agreia bicolorata]|uniref:WxL domain surface cell wall-binding n=1 Tax=Agreia bicolorata TaxID=110935 RepID=A0A1T4Y2A1_9MICO|nr:hypothetical protein TZ00_09875 [Agreia bicolorata]SKA95922.1 hypothetical protein SAMN06295879_2120 [Agreia bicolorata]